MLTGRVTREKEAMLPIRVLGPTGKRAPIEATIDTGYNGYLSLPSSLVTELGLPFAGTARATLADGKEVSLDLFLAAVEWDGGPKEVLVLQADGGILLGMATLGGSRLTLDVIDDGAVTIQPLAGLEG